MADGHALMIAGLRGVYTFAMVRGLGHFPGGGGRRGGTMPALALALALLAAGAAGAQTVAAAPPLASPLPAPVLVLPFNNHSGNLSLDWIGESFVQAFSDTLRTAAVPVLDRRQRAAAFNQEGVPRRSTLSQATLIQVAEQARAGWLILGSFTTPGGQFQATASIFDLKRQHLTRVSAGPAPLNQLETVQGQLAWRALQVVAPGNGIAEAEVLAQRQQVPIAAYERFIRGLLATEPPVRHKFLAAAVHLDPSYSRAMYQLGLWYWRNDDYRTALLWLPQVDPKDPDYPRAMFLAGQSAYRLGRYRRAAQLYARLGARWPLPEVLNNWALADARLHEREALALLARGRRAAAGTAAAPLLAVNSAAVACLLGQRRQALEAAESAQSPAGSALAGFVNTLSAAGAVCPNSAARELAQPAEEFPLAEFRERVAAQERADQAQAATLAAGQRLPFHLAAARGFLRQGALAAAQQELLAAVRLAPRDPDTHIGLVRLYLLRRDAPAARAQVAVLRAIAPHNSSIGALQQQIRALQAQSPETEESHAARHEEP